MLVFGGVKSTKSTRVNQSVVCFSGENPGDQMLWKMANLISGWQNVLQA